MWLNRFWSESRGLFGNGNRGLPNATAASGRNLVSRIPIRRRRSRLRAFRLNTIPSTEYLFRSMFSLSYRPEAGRVANERLATGKSYSGVFGFRLRRIGTIA
jgi:hypothetical protein